MPNPALEPAVPASGSFFFFLELVEEAILMYGDSFKPKFGLLLLGGLREAK
jgi:hypothetical protein